MERSRGINTQMMHKCVFFFPLRGQKTVKETPISSTTTQKPYLIHKRELYNLALQKTKQYTAPGNIISCISREIV